MKSIISLAIILLFSIHASFAQCGKNVKLYVSKTEFVDSLGNVQNAINEKTTVTIKNNRLIIGGGNDGASTIRGTIERSTCHWKIPYKEGKTVIHSPLKGKDVNRMFTITIKGEKGKISFVAIPDEAHNEIIKLAVYKFEAIR